MWKAGISKSIAIGVLLFCFLTATASLADDSRKRLALVIGNSAYENTVKLANPANDSRLMADALRRIGFEVDEHLNLTQKKLKRAVAKFSRKVHANGRHTVALFYYAGHGLQVSGVNYLVPVDAIVDAAGDIPIEGVSAADVLHSFESAGADVNVIILDACRNNPFKAASRSMQRGLARMDAPVGSIVAYSTSPGDVAADGDGANSPYTTALARHMATPGIAIEQVFKKVRIEVREKTGGGQTPWEESSLTKDVYFSGAPSVAAAKQNKVATDAPGTKTPEDPEIAYLSVLKQDTAEAYADFLKKYPLHQRASSVRSILQTKADEDVWLNSKNKNTLASYRHYLAAFPQGTYVNSAQRRIAALQKSTSPPPKPKPRPTSIPQAAPETTPQLSLPATGNHCGKLWVARNTIFKKRGFCFKTARAKSYFGNAGCWTSKPKLTRFQRNLVRKIVQLEKRNGCR